MNIKKPFWDIYSIRSPLLPLRFHLEKGLLWLVNKTYQKYHIHTLEILFWTIHLTPYFKAVEELLQQNTNKKKPQAREYLKLSVRGFESTKVDE